MSTDQPKPTPAPDPKEAMRAALEAKKAAQHGGNSKVAPGKAKGSAHGQAATKREFRRKSG